MRISLINKFGREESDIREANRRLTNNRSHNLPELNINKTKF